MVTTDITFRHQQRQHAAGECGSKRRYKPKKDTTERTKLSSNEFRTIIAMVHGNAAAAAAAAAGDGDGDGDCAAAAAADDSAAAAVNEDEDDEDDDEDDDNDDDDDDDFTIAHAFASEGVLQPAVAAMDGHT